MQEFSEIQKALMEKLGKMNFSREDIFSLMLVLTDEGKAKEFYDFLLSADPAFQDAIFQKAGEIAYGKEETEENL